MAKKRGADKGGPQPPQALWVRDSDTALGHDAETRAQRQASLLWCLNNSWVAADADTIERVDEGNWHGWGLWPRA